MSRPTPERWFVSDHEFYLSTNDYAVVSQLASAVCLEILSYDETSDWRKFETFKDFWKGLQWGPDYEFALPTRLLFADVDDTDVAHREKVCGEWAKETPLELASAKSEDLQKALAQDLAMTWILPLKDEGAEETPEEREQYVKSELQYSIDHGEELDEHIINHIITAKTPEDKQELLAFLSGQSKYPTQRPVLVLVAMMNSNQSTEMGKTEGWVIGHDLVKNLVIIKPFVSKEGKHPLGEKWYGDVASDGVSFSGTPLEFATSYLELAKTDPTPKSAPVGFRLLTHTLLAKHLLRHHAGLAATGFPIEAQALRHATKQSKTLMAGIPFPAKQKLPRNHGPVIKPLRWLQNWLELEEENIRYGAVEAREKGEEKIAENAREVYRAVYDLVRGFNDDPRGVS